MSKLNRILWSGLVLVGAACGDDVTVTPPPEPPAPGIRSVTVAPDGATIAVGATLTFTAAVTTDPGAATPTIAWSSSNTAVATVNATTGVVTAVAVGSVGIRATATSGTSTGSGVATLNVSSSAVTPATVSIQSIEKGGTPQNIQNLNGQVDVRVNLERGGESVQKVQLLVDGTVVQEQAFASASAQASVPETAIEEIVFPWNTAEFDTTTGAVKHLNGAHALTVKVVTSENETGSGSPTVQITLNNSNRAYFKVAIINGSSAAAEDDGRTWTTGDLEVTLVPVIYTTATPTIQQVLINPDGPLVTKIDTEGPYTQTWAKGTAFADGGSGGNGLPGVEQDEFDVCATATVNGNPVNLGCLEDQVGDEDLLPRYDNQAPAAPTVLENPNGRQAGWVNDAVLFGVENSLTAPNGLLDIAPEDAGVGGATYPARAGATLAAAIASTDIADATSLAPTASGTSLCLALYSVDALGNRSADPTDCDTGDADNNTRIGVDRAPPVLAYTAASLASGARQPGPSVGGEFIVTVADTGTIGNSGVLQPIPVRSNVVRRSADGTSFTDVPTDCVAGGGGVVVLTTCVRDTVGLVYTPPTLTTSIGGIAGAGTHGYYTHSAEARDGAGNATELPDGRVIVFDATPATATAPAVPAVIGGNFAAAAFINDDLSIRDYFFRVSYAPGFFAPTDINLGTPTVVDAFNAPTLNTINFGVNKTVDAFVGFQSAPGGVPAAYAPNASLSGLTVMVRDQAQTSYSASPTTPLAPTPPAAGIPVAGGAGSTAFVFATYAAATSQANICAGTLPAGCAAVPTSTVFSATASGTTGSFNNPFTRVDFYAASADGTTLVLIGSVPAASATLTDAGGLSRAWKYSLPMAAAALRTALGGGAAFNTNVYAFGVGATGSVALVSDPVVQTINP